MWSFQFTPQFIKISAYFGLKEQEKCARPKIVFVELFRRNKSCYFLATFLSLSIISLPLKQGTKFDLSISKAGNENLFFSRRYVVFVDTRMFCYLAIPVFVRNKKIITSTSTQKVTFTFVFTTFFIADTGDAWMLF